MLEGSPAPRMGLLTWPNGDCAAAARCFSAPGGAQEHPRSRLVLFAMANSVAGSASGRL